MTRLTVLMNYCMTDSSNNVYAHKAGKVYIVVRLL
jgi:hypothetical protein